MTVILIAIVLTFLSVVSGLYGITRQQLWDQEDGLTPYLKGDIGAWLYFIICGSTIISIMHLVLLINWMAVLPEEVKMPGIFWSEAWNVWHALTSGFFSMLHFIIIRFRTLRMRSDNHDKLIQRFW